MKLDFVSIQTPISDFYEDNRIVQKDVDESLILKWAEDAVGDLTTDEQLVHRIAWVDVTNYKVALPKDHVLFCEIAYKLDKKKEDCKVRGYQVVQYVQRTHEGCELELNIKCPSCHKAECDCHTDGVILDINTAFDVSHPEMYYDKYRQVGRFGYGSSIYDDRWRILCHTDNDFFGLNAHLPDCANIHCKECPHSYRVERPYIETSFEKGELLISYMGKKLDKDGNIMIPNHRYVFEAILQHLTYKWYRGEFLAKRDPSDRVIYQEAKMERDIAIMKANHVLGMPSFQEMSKFWSNNRWSKIDSAYDNMINGKSGYYYANVGKENLAPKQRNIYKG